MLARLAAALQRGQIQGVMGGPGGAGGAEGGQIVINEDCLVRLCLLLGFSFP